MQIPIILQPILFIAGIALCSASSLFISGKEESHHLEKRGKYHG